MYSWIRAILSNRAATVVPKGIEADSQEYKSGVPQGSPLSQAFNMFVAPALSHCHFNKAQFADDTPVRTSHNKVREAPTVLVSASATQHTLDR